ncbi:Wzz/FepE/Etk N-terminal domain-containing protein [Herbaspirillum chlorophenolicum]|uniref:Wzz/FepE/Etk N-terminal domain-containing protein n=1 Tax=Herbaspirillum chlorophenolicum TaxID=211589 RepID=UPI00067D0CD8|nr:Wzz/FepE/Etk N-terminal domain-containing protein [Herbaspirillum chlorophenolicum]
MQDKNGMAYPSDDIDFFDIVSFVVDYWKIIAACLIAGLAIAAGYLTWTPKQFEARALVKVAQVLSMPFIARQNNGNIGDSGKLASVNLEAPSTVAEQFRQPTAFSSDTVKACGVDSGETLVSKVLLLPSKTASEILEISTRADTPQTAEHCATAVFQQILLQQQQQLLPYKAELIRIQKDLELRYLDNQELLEKMEKVGAFHNMYFSRKDTAQMLHNQLDMIKQSMKFNADPHLLAPVYAPKHPVSPVRSKTIVFGAMSGLLLGLFLALSRLAYGKWRTRIRSA